jgi:dihydrofolate reductase
MLKRKISMIVAMDKNNAIGYQNNLMWHLPDDFKWFKEKTKGKPLIMGRNTMNSLKKPLPGRINIVISNRNIDIIDGFLYASGIDEAIKLAPEASEEVMVIGGGQIYKQMLHMADRMYITVVDHEWPDADTFFPPCNENEWEGILQGTPCNG